VEESQLMQAIFFDQKDLFLPGKSDKTFFKAAFTKEKQ
jgi:hypothetical protein